MRFRVPLQRLQVRGKVRFDWIFFFFFVGICSSAHYIYFLILLQYYFSEFLFMWGFCSSSNFILIILLFFYSSYRAIFPESVVDELTKTLFHVLKNSMISFLKIKASCSLHMFCCSINGKKILELGFIYFTCTAVLFFIWDLFKFLVFA